MKRVLSILLTLMLLLPLFASCGGQAAGPGETSGSEAHTEGPSEPVSEEEGTVPATEPEPAETGKYPTEYVAPEDGSFTVCGIPLSEYTPMLYWGMSADYNYMERKPVVDRIEGLFESAGCPLDVSIVRSEKYNTVPKEEHEILFGVCFQREGMPEYDPMKNYYGVTEDGTVYFCSPSPILYPYLLERFAEEFLGVAPGSGESSDGCTVTPCYREIPAFDSSRVEAEGYGLVLEERFDGDSLDLTQWEIANREYRIGYETSSQVSVSEGNLILTGEYRTDGSFGEGWYGASVNLQQRYCRGYFEARIRASETIGKGNGDYWSAFWIEGSNPYDPDASQGGLGPGGAELDILENFGPDCTTCTVHVSGYEGNDGISSQHAEIFDLGNNYVDDYHVYSLFWTEEYYEYYLDGVLLNHTSFGYGTSSSEEIVILSLEVPRNFSIGQDVVRKMYVDYLRIWQKPTEE